ncbi:MAG: hypothetical protein LBL51_03060 [Synergistaceae bacterium]|nr:hypothetical protein [Synergistaceae bacterium]
MSWKWAALTPHPPVLVPEVGHGREKEAAATLAGLSRLTEKLRRPDFLLLLSPHQPYAAGALLVNAAPRLSGSFAPFGAPSVALAPAPPPGERISTLLTHLASKNVPVLTAASPDLTRDQGTLVPLFFLRRAWGEENLPPVLAASPIGLDLHAAFRLGQALASFEDRAEWALLASGDLSHRLTPDAPAGYSPAGKKFDAAVVEALSSRDPASLLRLPSREIEDAGECGLRSVLAMLGLCGALGKPVEVLSYEGPFGVGYCNAFSPLGEGEEGVP